MVFLASLILGIEYILLQYSCCENPVNTMKKQKVMTPKVEPPRSVGVQHVTGEEQRGINDSSRKNGGAGPMQK